MKWFCVVVVVVAAKKKDWILYANEEKMPSEPEWQLFG